MAEDEITVAVQKTRLGLLADIRDGRVADNADGIPCLLVDGEWVPVATAVDALHAGGLCMPADESPAWILTQRGEDTLNGSY